MTILVTGIAGFIGYHTAQALLAHGQRVIGVDNLNDYYDVHLKEARLTRVSEHKNCLHYILDIADKAAMEELFKSHPEITHIIHLAAQAGVRYSIENPFAYVHSNLVGQMVMLECARHAKKLQHFVYASSSSVYGEDAAIPFSTDAACNAPISLYAATKKSDEMLSHAYAHLYNIPMTALRFFTVYGPWGRPDMAPFLFTKAILTGEKIRLFNHGKMKRDFTYIDDIISGVLAAMEKIPKNSNSAPHRIYNLGNHRAEELMHFVRVLEDACGKKAIVEFSDMQPGDMVNTYADISETIHDLNFSPSTAIEEGLPRFVKWYRDFYHV